MWKFFKRLFLALFVIAVVAAALFITFVGPWPTYASVDLEKAEYYQDALADIDAHASESAISNAPGPLRAGWASRSITPPAGTPLAGYGDRGGEASSGVHDTVQVKAIALSDGADTVVLLGSDMLVVPENISEPVRERVAEATGLTPDDILFNASHSHSGPGAVMPGLVASMFGGKYDPRIPEMLITAFSEAIEEAQGAMAPAAIAFGSADAADYIRNRVREAKVDPELSFMLVEREDGTAAHVVSFSAHATVLGGNNMEFSADYPGFLQRAIENETGGFAMFLAGAVGSMGPRSPEGGDGFEKARLMGEGLARKVLEASPSLEPQNAVEIASIGIPIGLPPFQIRLNPKWRLSPLLPPRLGIDHDAWMQGVRLGETMLLAAPADFSGEISVELKEWAAQQGFDAWVLSFNGDYVGYISPDEYYETASNSGDDAYEMYIMSWMGPSQEEFFTGLMKHALLALARSDGA